MCAQPHPHEHTTNRLTDHTLQCKHSESFRRRRTVAVLRLPAKLCSQAMKALSDQVINSAYVQVASNAVTKN